jgi:hypothetical protein
MRALDVLHGSAETEERTRGSVSAIGCSRSTDRDLLDRLTDLVVADVGFITNMVVDGESISVRLDDNVYVHREIEPDIQSVIASANQTEATLIAIVGEAGTGKTCLLHQLYRWLHDGKAFHPWFLNATMISVRSNENMKEETAVPACLVRAAHHVRSGGRVPVLLLDTVDLLLHSEVERDGLIILLSRLLDAEVRIIVSCRKHELKLLEAIKLRVFALSVYSGQEIDEAIEKHVRVFCVRTGLDDIEVHRGRVLDSVSRGTPLREICENPLTLRMFFALYSPESVGEEMNVLELYSRFWEDRVKNDRRMGLIFSSTQMPDLSDAAYSVSMGMLAEGFPDLDAKTAIRVLEDWGGDLEQVNELCSRGVLRRSQTGRIRFFHQTFFEHSAARLLLCKLGVRGLTAVSERVYGSSNDNFLRPVYEQMLMLAEFQPGPVRDWADNVLLRMAKSDSVPENITAVYVYAHRQIDRKLSAVSLALQAAEKAVLQEYVRAAANMPPQRLTKLMTDLDHIWQRGIWEVQRQILELMERLAGRSPERTLMFLKRHEVLGFVLARENLADRKLLLPILSVLASHAPEWCFETLAEMFSATTTKTQHYRLHSEIVAVLIKNRAIFGPSSSIARRFEELVKISPDLWSPPLRRVVGPLWAEEWRAQTLTIQVCYELAKRMRGEGMCDFWLYAIRCYLDAAPRTVLQEFFDLVREEADRDLQRLCIDVVIREMFSVINFSEWEDVDHTYSIPLYAAELVFFHLVSRLAELEEDTERAEDDFLVGLLINAIIREPSAPAAFIPCLKGKNLSVGIWLDIRYLGKMIAQGVSMSIAPALRALEQLTTDPGQFSPKLRTSVLSQLCGRVSESQGMSEAFLTLVFYECDANKLLQGLKAARSENRRWLVPWRDKLIEWKRDLLSDSSSDNRRAGYAVWLELLRLELVEPPTVTALRAAFGQEDKCNVKISILNLIGEGCKLIESEPDELLDFLCPIAEGMHEGLRNFAFRALTKVMKSAPMQSIDATLRYTQIGISEYTDSGRIKQVGEVLVTLLPYRVGFAVKLLGMVLGGENVKALGRQAKRDVFTNLRRPARLIARAIGLDAASQLLTSIKQLDPQIARIVVDAMCNAKFEDLIEQFELMLNDKSLDSTIRRQIHLQMAARQRWLPGGEWPELYTLMVSSKT